MAEDGHMDEASIPDDIKIIAQFLAGQAAPSRPRKELTRDEFKLRRELEAAGRVPLGEDGGAASGSGSRASAPRTLVA